MKNRVVVLLSMLFGATVLMLNGCASIVHGVSQKETFKSVPNGAQVKIDGQSYGNTPVTAKLKRKKTHLVDINLPGYQPAQFRLDKRVSGWFFGNLLLGGVVGIVVDSVDGAIYTLEPSELTNDSDDQLQEGKHNTITIVLAKQVPAKSKQNKIGQLKKA